MAMKAVPSVSLVELQQKIEDALKIAAQYNFLYTEEFLACASAACLREANDEDRIEGVEREVLSSSAMLN